MGLSGDMQSSSWQPPDTLESINLLVSTFTDEKQPRTSVAPPQAPALSNYECAVPARPEESSDKGISLQEVLAESSSQAMSEPIAKPAASDLTAATPEAAGLVAALAAANFWMLTREGQSCHFIEKAAFLYTDIMAQIPTCKTTSVGVPDLQLASFLQHAGASAHAQEIADDMLLAYDAVPPSMQSLFSKLVLPCRICSVRMLFGITQAFRKTGRTYPHCIICESKLAASRLKCGQPKARP